MLTVANSGSTARAQSPRGSVSVPASPSLEQALVATLDDLQHLPWLYGSLLSSRVYVTDYELVLGEQGPYLELAPSRDPQGPAMSVYTSLTHADEPLEAELIPFTAVLAGLRPGVAVVLNPAGPLRHRLGPDTVERLRRVLAQG